MNLWQWACIQGIEKHTGCRLFHIGDIPNARQMSTGTLLIDRLTGPAASGRKVGYAGCRSSDLKDDLRRRADRFRLAGCDDVVGEVSSGLHGARPKLKRVVAGTDDVVEHRERLTSFCACLYGRRSAKNGAERIARCVVTG